MRNFVQLLLLAIAVVGIGCQRSYITSDNPDFPVNGAQISSAKWSNEKLSKDSNSEKLKNYAVRNRSAEPVFFGQ
ncbi:MAG: hypothetical protein HON53_21425 [Planctomycetaceae bacterium]|jgi:hypothetical protein|nr:hypothetical protein [Planctomycetaceae bacterium]MBT6156069.1 hypothetical protein [Planctomycetaceae bacterium]MBT6487490.1 hypothetical protein [Planctomycetaceae bacterium]MBT6495883.1 hypothetical protein [Planctomycetaceae bacterium]